MLTLVLGVVGISIGLIFVTLGFLVRRHNKFTWTWPETIATVVESKVKEYKWGNEYEDWDAYDADIKWEYSVGGSSFTRTDPPYVVSQGNPHENLAEEAVARNYPGKTFSVRYPPDDPGKAIFGPTNPAWGFIVVLIGATMLTSGVLLMLTGTSVWPLLIAVGAGGGAGAIIWSLIVKEVDPPLK